MSRKKVLAYSQAVLGITFGLWAGWCELSIGKFMIGMLIMAATVFSYLLEEWQ